jgi:hypothetical protein
VIRHVIRGAVRTYREQFARVAGTAFVVFGVIAAIDAVVAVLVADHHVSHPVGAALASAAAGVMAMAGVVLYAGILDRVVGAHLHGHPDAPIPQILRDLPLGRLVLADLLLALAMLGGTALGVIPGLILFTFCCLVGPVVNIENRAVLDAFRRSAQLVRSAFVVTLCVVTVPIAVEQGVLHAIQYTAVFEHPLVPALLLNGLLGAAVGSFAGLLEVVLAHELIRRSNDHPIEGHRGELSGARPAPAA